MEYVEVNSNDRMNITSFSEIISEKWDVDADVVINYIFANISVSLAKDKETKKDIDKIYMSDKAKYYNLATNSTCINHVVLMEGTIEQEIYARRVLGILIEAETNSIARGKIIKVLRRHYPIIYNAVRKHDKEKLKNKYIKMDIITRNEEARFDAAIYLYFAIHISSEIVDQGFIISILNDIEDFEFSNLINRKIEEQLEKYKSEIQEIKVLIKQKYGKIFNYKDVLRHNNKDVRNLGEFLEDLFITNKLNINNIFQDSEFINIDKVILSYARAVKDKELEDIIPNVVSGIFIQSFINEYKNARNLYFENSVDSVNYEISELEEKINSIERENSSLKYKINDLNKEKLLYEKKLNHELNKLNNIHKLEIKAMEEKIKNLENRFNEEKSLRLNLEFSRKYELETGNNYENLNLNKNLKDYIINKKIIIIGGDKEWRRKFRIKYPEIRTLNGFNENFDMNILNKSDYIFFYTKYMNHSTFHKAMNFIKINQCKFGYVGKTNMDLVEQEIIEKISSYENIKQEDILRF